MAFYWSTAHPLALLEQHSQRPNHVSCLLNPSEALYNRHRYHPRDLAELETHIGAMFNKRRYSTFSPGCLGHSCSNQHPFQHRYNTVHPLSYLFELLECERSKNETEDKQDSENKKDEKPKDKSHKKSKTTEDKTNNCSTKPSCSTTSCRGTTPCGQIPFELDPFEYIFNILDCFEQYKNKNVSKQNTDDKEINTKEDLKSTKNVDTKENELNEDTESTGDGDKDDEVSSQNHIKSDEIKDENVNKTNNKINTIPNPPSSEAIESNDIPPNSNDDNEKPDDSANEIKEHSSSSGTLDSLIIKRTELKKALELLEMQMSQLENK